MIYYITYNDQPSGIYSSQVIDVVKYLRRTFDLDIHLIAIISLRDFSRNRYAIKEQLPNAIVLPMVPKLKNWKWNVILLFFCFLIKRPRAVVCRNALPTQLALYLKKCLLVKKVVYDGRGVEYEQMKEYAIVSDKLLMQDVFEREKVAVLKSDFQMAVTHELVNYWREKFNYSSRTYVVIPCTLNSNFMFLDSRQKGISRTDLGFEDTDVVLVYSGSTSGWQSFKLLLDFFETHLPNYPNLKLLMLTKLSLEVKSIIEKHNGRVVQKWCSEAEVISYLGLADYGILLREPSLTNQVASPVKFAEYLAAGLDVIISENLKDYAGFLSEHLCGFVYSQQILKLVNVGEDKRFHNRNLAKHFLSKESISVKVSYKTLLDNL